jgi:hypothetical protein
MIRIVRGDAFWLLPDLTVQSEIELPEEKRDLKDGYYYDDLEPIPEHILKTIIPPELTVKTEE